MMLECMDYEHLTKDRSLGSTELVVSDLASPAPEDIRYPFKSSGIKTFSSPLRQDGGGAFKGTLHYTAEFVPAVALKDLKFESRQLEVNKLAKRKEHDEEGGGIVTDESSSEDEDGEPAEVTIKSERRRTLSLKQKEESGGSIVTSEPPDSKDANESDKAKPDAIVKPKQEEVKGVEMTTEELLAQRESIKYPALNLYSPLHCRIRRCCFPCYIGTAAKESPRRSSPR